MSNPPNPLADFQTYSSLHTLVMCDGMATARRLYTNLQAFESAGNDPEQLFTVEDIQRTDGGEEGKYIIVLDGRQEARFSIKSVEWETILAPVGNDGESKFDQIETEGEMVIEEPFGIDFMRLLVEGTRALNVDPSSVVFMLKTYFVGYDSNGRQKVINNVLPFTFVMVDLAAKLKAGGATYKIVLFGTSNGVSKLPQISSIGNGLNLRLNKGDTLASAIEELNNKLALRYTKFKEEIITALDTALNDLNTNDVTKLVNERYFDVVYRVKLSEPYDSPVYVIGDNESHNKVEAGSTNVDSGDENEPVASQTFNLKASPNDSVEAIIRKIIKKCPRILEETKENDKQVSYSHKIVTSLEPPEISGTYEMHYTVNRFERKHQEFGVPLNPSPGEFIEFDYIYTGRNIDILDYDIKMEMGLAFFQTKLSGQTQRARQVEDGNDQSVIQSSVSSGEPHAGVLELGTDKIPNPTPAPLFLGMSVRPNQFTDTAKPAQDATFDEALAKHAALENIQARIKIIGNSQLLNETLTIDSSGQNIRISEENAALSSPYTRPGLVRINVQYPTDKSLNGVRKFWYDGFFNIFSIKNKFSDGVFTQELDLFSVPASSKVVDALEVQSETAERTGNEASTADTVPPVIAQPPPSVVVAAPPPFRVLPPVDPDFPHFSRILATPDESGVIWPEERDLEKFYGRPGDGWVSMKLPFPMRIAWRLDSTINSFQVHELVRPHAEAMFDDILSAYGRTEITNLRLDLFAGCANIRTIRGGTRQSSHSYACAIDIASLQNSLRTKRDAALFARPEYEDYWKAVYRNGGRSLGIEKNYDFMHFGWYNYK